MASDPLIPDTRVLAIASHVVHGYVGNKMATFVMQSMGCDVSAINTVHYSNHTAYKQVKGTKTSAQEIMDLYDGLRQSNLSNFDVLLTGYMPSAEAVRTIGKIGRDVKFNAGTKPGSFFWVLDPVMGDNGKLYIPEDEVPEYKSLLREADLILPNQFEAELLSDTPITDLKSLATAIQVLHKTYRVPHVIITSLRLTPDNHTISSRVPSKAPSTSGSGTHTPTHSSHLDASTSHPSTWPTSASTSETQTSTLDLSTVSNLTIIGSTATSTFTPRLFRIDTPQLPLFFSGTGDMFAALTIPRLIEAVNAVPGLASTASWRSPDDVSPQDLPLAKAVQKVLASMQAVLAKTTEKCEVEMKTWDERARRGSVMSPKTEMPVDNEDGEQDGDAEDELAKKRHLALMNASEVKVVRYVKDLLDPPDQKRFEPRAVEEGVAVESDVGLKKADGLDVLHLGAGVDGEGEMQVVVGHDGEEKGGEVEGKEIVESGLSEVQPGLVEAKDGKEDGEKS